MYPWLTSEAGVVLLAIALLLPASSVHAAALTRSGLANTTYRVDYGQSRTVQLVNGRAEVAESEGKMIMVLTDVAGFGDLDGDGVDDAAAILVTSTGGTGSFYDLVAVVARDEAPVHAATAALGDRVRVDSVVIADWRVTVIMVTHRPEDPQCCPTLQVTKTYRLNGTRLLEE